jgi:hypothetical protein
MKVVLVVTDILVENKISAHSMCVIMSHIFRGRVVWTETKILWLVLDNSFGDRMSPTEGDTVLAHWRESGERDFIILQSSHEPRHVKLIQAFDRCSRYSSSSTHGHIGGREGRTIIWLHLSTSKKWTKESPSLRLNDWNALVGLKPSF